MVPGGSNAIVGPIVSTRMFQVFVVREPGKPPGAVAWTRCGPSCRWLPSRTKRPPCRYARPVTSAPSIFQRTRSSTDGSAPTENFSDGSVAGPIAACGGGPCGSRPGRTASRRARTWRRRARRRRRPRSRAGGSGGSGRRCRASAPDGGRAAVFGGGSGIGLAAVVCGRLLRRLSLPGGARPRRSGAGSRGRPAAARAAIRRPRAAVPTGGAHRFALHPRGKV